MRNRFLRGLMPALALAALTALPALASAGVFIGVSVNFAPPPLPVYVQPPCPEPGYLWVPGYWAWDDGDYYWVPGTWVLPPRVGFLWTPGYWGWDEGVYGGVNYGFGYDGDGFVGGYWRRDEFFYNRAVMRVGPTFVTNVYYHQVIYRRTDEHVSFNGGPGGIRARPSREQMAVEHEHHVAFTPVQERQQRMAFADRSLRADYNHGRPPIAATARPVMFHGHGVVAARAAGGPVHLAPAREAPRMRSDRPAWASGQPYGARPTQRSAPLRRAQPSFERPQQRFQNAPTQRWHSAPPQQRWNNPPPQRWNNAPPQRFEARPPQNGFREGGGYRPMQRPQAPPPPQFHQQFRPQERAPAMRAAPPQPPRGGGRPAGPPQEHRGGGRGR
jgi:hypothetical protein